MSGLEVQSLDGRGNNRAHTEWGLAGSPYPRTARPRFADGHSAPVSGPPSRYVSNRIFNDTNQNLFSENGVTQWGFTWGQFLDHTFGLRDEAGEPADMAFDAKDPLESFVNTLGYMPFARSAPAPGTGVTNPRQQINTVSSYIDAWVVYGGTADRLEWLREGPVDGKMGNNGAKLLMASDGLLPKRDSRGDATTAPTMAIDGRLRGQPNVARVAGDVRANENIALLATHTLFAREHNRIVSLLPPSLTAEQKFQIARRIVIAEQQYITYTEFLPALGVRLSPYRGYNPRVNPSLTNEFATVGYRAHSMIHGEIEMETDASRYSPEQLAAFEREGIEFELSEDGTEIELAVPLNVAFFNPELVGSVAARPTAAGHRARGAVQERRADRQPAAQCSLPDPRTGQPTLPRRADAAGVLPWCRGPGRARRRARSGPWDAELQPASARVRARHEALVPGHHRGVHRGVRNRSGADAG